MSETLRLRDVGSPCGLPPLFSVSTCGRLKENPSERPYVREHIVAISASIPPLPTGRDATVNSLSKHWGPRAEETEGRGCRQTLAASTGNIQGGFSVCGCLKQEDLRDLANTCVFEGQTVLKAELPWGI